MFKTQCHKIPLKNLCSCQVIHENRETFSPQIKSIKYRITDIRTYIDKTMVLEKLII